MDPKIIQLILALAPVALQLTEQLITIITTANAGGTISDADQAALDQSLADAEARLKAALDKVQAAAAANK